MLLLLQLFKHMRKWVLFNTNRHEHVRKVKLWENYWKTMGKSKTSNMAATLGVYESVYTFIYKTQTKQYLFITRKIHNIYHVMQHIRDFDSVTYHYVHIWVFIPQVAQA